MKKILRCASILATLGLGLSSADTDSASVPPKVGFKSSGYVFWENFRIWEADYAGTQYKGDWFNSILGGFVLENAMSERLKTRVALEARLFRPFPREQGGNAPASLLTQYDAYVHEAKAVYSFGNIEHPSFEAEVGYFLYDYNKDQHNLGEYLFRSKIYPTILFTDFELPEDRLLGIRIGNRPFKGFHHDLLLTSEYKTYPKSDYSLSYLADYNLGGVLQLGAGVSFVNLFPVIPSLETPNNPDNVYYQIPAQTWTDSAGQQHTIAQPITFMESDWQNGKLTQADSFSAQADPFSARHIYPQIKGVSTTKYTFQGTKVMLRATLDPKPLLGSPTIFGKEDLKLYSEVAILGLKDYPLLYESIKQRIPMMVGFNFPAFNLLDVIGLEIEYCANQYPNNWWRALQNGLPQPGQPSDDWASSGSPNLTQDDWKWSVYVRKEISRGLFVSAQAASDHLRLPDREGHTFESLMKDTGNPFTQEWWGIIRVTASY
jgi:hypothetical protein